MGEDLLQAPWVCLQQLHVGGNLNLDRRRLGSGILDHIAGGHDGFADANGVVVHLDKSALDTRQIQYVVNLGEQMLAIDMDIRDVGPVARLMYGTEELLL